MEERPTYQPRPVPLRRPPHPDVDPFHIPEQVKLLAGDAWLADVQDHSLGRRLVVPLDGELLPGAHRGRGAAGLARRHRRRAPASLGLARDLLGDQPYKVVVCRDRDRGRRTVTYTLVSHQYGEGRRAQWALTEETLERFRVTRESPSERLRREQREEAERHRAQQARVAAADAERMERYAYLGRENDLSYVLSQVAFGERGRTTVQQQVARDIASSDWSAQVMAKVAAADLAREEQARRELPRCQGEEDEDTLAWSVP